MQRQYVETFTALLVVVTSTELQKGQAFGATIASVVWVYTRIASERCGSIGPASAAERICGLVTDHRNLAVPVRIAQ